jgi:class 3 adenylate cyclase
VSRDDLLSGAVTFMFTDVEGSTRLLDEIGEAPYAEALAWHRGVIRCALERHHGVEVDTQGDAFFCVFADANEAVAAAAEVHAAFRDGPARVRIGLHTGTPVVTDEGYVGREVHRGARIAAAGHGGQVLLSRGTYELVEVEVTDLGEHRVKDFAEPVWLYQLGTERFPPIRTISNTNLPRPTSSFVGRKRQVAKVITLLRDGARLLTLSGAGGSGKTRLAIEAASELVPSFRNGVFWVGLAPVQDPDLVEATIAEALGANVSLAEHIGTRELLLLLDNFERLERSGEAEEVRRRHVEFFLGLAESANLTTEALELGEGQRQELVLPEEDNLRAALDHATRTDPELGLRLAVASSNSG